jgi:hypothetical protein
MESAEIAAYLILDALVSNFCKLGSHHPLFLKVKKTAASFQYPSEPERLFFT